MQLQYTKNLNPGRFELGKTTDLFRSLLLQEFSAACFSLQYLLSIDSEACGIGWKPFRDSCYKMMTSGKTWRQGFEHCKSAGSQLVKVTDQEELTYIYFTFVKPLNSGSAWMGLSLKNGSFYWTDGSKPRYKNWNYGEPNNFNGREHCVEIYVNNGKWNDIPCFVKRPFVCERGMYFLKNTDLFEVARKTGSVEVELNHRKFFGGHGASFILF